MHLLVYGGNQYEERRRIGVWPKTITTEILQERYGLSERKPAFGVGLFGETPFLIFRRIEPHKERTYPLTVLLDPGEAVWEEYEWNAAHLLYTLFVEDESPGQKILYEAEKFHSAQDLEKLFQELERKSLPDAAISADEEKVWQWWIASLTSATPVIASPDGEVIGLNARPAIASMANLLSRVPASLRTGKGWLIGGNQGQVKPMGVHFVFDDGKTVANAAEVGKQTLEMVQQGKEYLAAFDAAHNAPAVASFFNQPLWQWEKQSEYTAHELFSDLAFWTNLSQPSAALSSNQLDETLDAVIKRLESGKWPMHDEICEAASQIALATQGSLTPGRTRFVLFYAYENNKALNDETAQRIDVSASVEFFVEKGHYPSEIDSLLPVKIGPAVCRELLKKEERYEQIPEILDREVLNLYETAEPEELEKIVRTAVLCTTKSSESLASLWLPYVNGQFIKDWLNLYLTEAARAALIKQITESSDVSADKVKQMMQSRLEDYFTFGEDSGGQWLAETTLDSPLISFLIQHIIAAFQPRSKKNIAYHIEEWLRDMASTLLRAKVSAKDKVDIADKVIADAPNRELEKSWATFVNLKKLLRGEIESPQDVVVKIIKEHTAERDLLLRELDELLDLAKQSASDTERLNYAPSLKGLLKLVGDEHHHTLARSLLSLKANLKHKGAKPWLKGWLALAYRTDNIGGESWEKYQQEWCRFIFESDEAIKNDEELSSHAVLGKFPTEKLIPVFVKLLFSDGVEKDDKYSARFSELLEIGEKVETFRQGTQIAFERFAGDAAREAFLRRYAAREGVRKKLRKILTVEQREELDNALNEHERWQVEKCQEQLSLILLHRPVEKFDEGFQQLKEVTANKHFKTALANIITNQGEVKTDRDLLIMRLSDNKPWRRQLKNNLEGEWAREQLDALIKEGEQRRIRKEIHGYLYSDDEEADDKSRSKFGELLKRRFREEGIPSAVEAEIIDGLSDTDQLKKFKRRFIQRQKAYRAKAAELKVIDSIFDCLPWPQKKSILKFFYQEDKDVFTIMAKNICDEVYRSNNILSLFQKAVLEFLKTNDPVAQAVKRQLVNNYGGNDEEVKSVLEMVKDPEPEMTESENYAVKKLGDKEGKGETKKEGVGAWGKVKGLFNSILGDKDK